MARANLQQFSVVFSSVTLFPLHFSRPWPSMLQMPSFFPQWSCCSSVVHLGTASKDCLLSVLAGHAMHASLLGSEIWETNTIVAMWHGWCSVSTDSVKKRNTRPVTMLIWFGLLEKLPPFKNCVTLLKGYKIHLSHCKQVWMKQIFSVQFKY